MNDLFGNPIETAMPKKRGGHAAAPGTGPAGKTCRTCEHYTRAHLESGRIVRKCGLMEVHWTRGPGTDIRAKDAACRHYEARTTNQEQGGTDASTDQT
jgi:hypothetical protein